MAFDGSKATIGYPFLLIQTERPYTSTAPVNLGYIKTASVSGGETTGGIEAANSLSFIRRFLDTHELTIDVESLEVADSDLLLTIFGVSAYEGTNLLRVKANRDLREVQVQLLCPDMSDMSDPSSASLAYGIYVPRAVMTLTYDATLDGKDSIAIHIKFEALENDQDFGTTESEYAKKGDLFIQLKPGASINVSADGTGYSIKGWDS